MTHECNLNKANPESQRGMNRAHVKQMQNQRVIPQDSPTPHFIVHILYTHKTPYISALLEPCLT